MRIGIVTDIHEDIISLKEAMILFEKHNCNEIICLGDMIGYDRTFYNFNDTKNASEVLSVIENNCKIAVVGNHDLFALQKLPQNNLVFSFTPNWYDIPIETRSKSYSNQIWLYETEENANLTPRAFEYLNSLPEYAVAEYAGKRIFISHSLHPDLTGSVQVRFHNPWELRNHAKMMIQHDCLYGFSGHMHPAGLLSGTTKQINLYPFGEYHIIDELMQFSLPALVNGKNKSGITILDLEQNYIETIRINAKNNIFMSLYERIFK